MGRLDTSGASGERAIMPVPLQIGLGAWITGVILAAFLWVPPAAGFAAPEAARIVVFHVPCAMVAVVAYLVSTAYAIAYLARRSASSDAKSAASAGLGFLFTVLATVTGMVFAQVQWGSAWNWDPRETSILMLMIVYAAYFALRGAIPGSVARARISASYNVLACLVMPYLVFVMPRLMGGLHPTGTLSGPGALSTEYRVVLACAMLGFVWLYVWMLRIQVRLAECEAARGRKKSV